MVDFLTGLSGEVLTLVRAVLLVGAVFVIGSTWFRTKALIPTLGSLLVAGVVLWSTSDAGLARLQTWIGQDAAYGPALDTQLLAGVDGIGHPSTALT